MFVVVVSFIVVVVVVIVMVLNKIRRREEGSAEAERRREERRKICLEAAKEKHVTGERAAAREEWLASRPSNSSQAMTTAWFETAGAGARSSC